jgi:hypothetical protein
MAGSGLSSGGGTGGRGGPCSGGRGRRYSGGGGGLADNYIHKDLGFSYL